MKSLLRVIAFAVMALRIHADAAPAELPGADNPNPNSMQIIGGRHYAPSPLKFQASTLGEPPTPLSRITNVQIVDFDGDGLMDVIACDARTDQVLWYRQMGEDRWKTNVLADNVADPAHATVIDLDQDGDLDVVVSVLGDIEHFLDRNGRLLWLERDGENTQTHVILDGVRRVADAQPGDFDGDGDLDLAVAIFGYSRGNIYWLENKGNGRFREHELMSAPGAIHTPVADYDGDGDLDIATVISQDEEEVWGFENLGNGEFRRHLIYFSVNYDLGSAGLVQVDLDGDGDQDLLLPVGDNLENADRSFAQPYHGCYWLENQGEWNFKARRIARLGGCYAAAAGDLDGDGDQDVVLVSMDNEWSVVGNPSIVWLENDGQQNFQTWSIADRPINLITVACGDLNGDGRVDIVTGGLRWLPPWDRLGRVTMFRNQGRVDTAQLQKDGGDDKDRSAAADSGIPSPDMTFLDHYTADALREKRKSVQVSVEAGSESAAGWQQLADAYHASGFFRSAEACYRKASDMGADSFLFCYRWATCCDRLGRMSQAIELFRKATELGDEKQQANCWYTIGQLHLRLEQSLEAERAFEKAGSFFLARYQLAKLYLRSDRSGEAIFILDDLLKKSSYAIQPLWLRGRAAELMGDQRKASEYFERADRATIFTALDINKSIMIEIGQSYGLELMLAKVVRLTQHGQIEDAAAIMKNVLELRPEDTYSRLHVSASIVALRQNKTEQAIDLLKRRIELFGASPLRFDSLDLLGHAYVQGNEKELAAKTWERAIGLSPTAELHGQLSNLYAKMPGQVAKSRHHQNRAHYHAGTVALTNNKLGEAIANLKIAVAGDPQDALAWFQLAQALRFLGMNKEAIAAYDKCLAINPDFGRAYTGMERLKKSASE